MTTIKISIEKDNGWDCEGSTRENLSATFKTDGSQNGAEQIAASIASLLAGFENIPIKATHFGDPELKHNDEEIQKKITFLRIKEEDSLKFQEALFKKFGDADSCTFSKQDLYDLVLIRSTNVLEPIK